MAPYHRRGRDDYWGFGFLGFDEHLDRKGLEEYVQEEFEESGHRLKIHYDGGWLRPLAMLLAAGIIGIQIYTRLQARKSESH